MALNQLNGLILNSVPGYLPGHAIQSLGSIPSAMALEGVVAVLAQARVLTGGGKGLLHGGGGRHLFLSSAVAVYSDAGMAPDSS